MNVFLRRCRMSIWNRLACETNDHLSNLIRMKHSWATMLQPSTCQDQRSPTWCSGGREHPEHQNLSAAMRMLLGCGRPLYRKLILGKGDPHDLSSGLEGHAILLTQPSTGEIQAQLPPLREHLQLPFGGGTIAPLESWSHSDSEWPQGVVDSICVLMITIHSGRKPKQNKMQNLPRTQTTTKHRQQNKQREETNKRQQHQKQQQEQKQEQKQLKSRKETTQ